MLVIIQLRGNTMVYLNRVVVDEIKEKLSIVEAVQIKGPKWCGKTTSAK